MSATSKTTRSSLPSDFGLSSEATNQSGSSAQAAPATPILAQARSAHSSATQAVIVTSTSAKDPPTQHFESPADSAANPSSTSTSPWSVPPSAVSPVHGVPYERAPQSGTSSRASSHGAITRRAGQAHPSGPLPKTNPLIMNSPSNLAELARTGLGDGEGPQSMARPARGASSTAHDSEGLSAEEQLRELLNSCQ